VYDLVYNPPVTKLLQDASRAGCDTIGGLAMLVGQAERQCEWWTGVRPPENVMQAAAIRALGELARWNEDDVTRARTAGPGVRLKAATAGCRESDAGEDRRV
jgi:hypothetical protein